jgi:hypothetical protein
MTLHASVFDNRADLTVRLQRCLIGTWCMCSKDFWSASSYHKELVYAKGMLQSCEGAPLYPCSAVLLQYVNRLYCLAQLNAHNIWG